MGGPGVVPWSWSRVMKQQLTTMWKARRRQGGPETVGPSTTRGRG